MLGKCYGWLTLVGALLYWGILLRLSRFAAGFRSTRQLLSIWPHGPAILSPRIAIFMHFDRYGRVSDAARFYIKELATAGYSVVFVTNSGKLSPRAETALRESCGAILVRRNIGYDFGAWREAIEVLNLLARDPQELIIFNDSMYGPLRPLGAMLARLDYAQADIWGLTESWQHRYHLQSFFLAFGHKALQAPEFAKFWRDIRPVPFKLFIIREYEIGFTQKMLKAGLKCKAIWPYEELVGHVAGIKTLQDLDRTERSRMARTDPIFISRKFQIHRIRAASARQVALNPTADLWRQLLLSGFPFIKRELLRKNPSHVEDIGDWVSVVRGELGLDPEPILNELRAGLKNRAP